MGCPSGVPPLVTWINPVLTPPHILFGGILPTPPLMGIPPSLDSFIFVWSILLYFGTIKYELLATIVRTFFDKNISNQFYIRLYVQIFNKLFCLLLKISINYLLINTFKSIYHVH